ncbi:histidinol dehydrogenase, partial [Enterobacter mori]
MVYILKSGKDKEEVKHNDEKISGIVSNTIKTILGEGDKALRDLSVKFDNWNPESFSLDDNQERKRK